MSDQDTIGQIDEWYDPDFPYPHLDPPQSNDIRWVDADKAFIKVIQEPSLHWSERQALGYRMEPRKEYELGDQEGNHSDDQGWDIDRDAIKEQLMEEGKL
jgi:hypothetical protein